MANNITELLQGIVGELRTIARSETVVGQPVSVGGRTVIPITRITVGFGVGGGEGSQTDKATGFGGGGGGGAMVEPAVFLVLEPDKVSVLPAKKKGSFDALLDAAPEVVELIKKWTAKKDGGESPKDSTTKS
ncbi:MAG TPA: spore germination protein GerW family protein [candidate division Zixibacteria bacterium]|jgi:uncharacterized spore protein YtfJ